MITSIELRNWKTHKGTTFNFSRGTNILIGQMGAGKSSVMDAISFALFGKFPAMQQRRVSVGRIITSRPSQMNEALVRLAFTVDDDTYTVERSFDLDGESKAKFEKNGAYVQSQPQRVTEEVSKVLKVDYDLFSKAVYAEQNGLDYFLSLSAGDRKKQIDRLLGLDKFALAQENATSLSNRIRDMADEAERLASGFDKEKLEKQLDTMSKERNAAADEKESLDRKLAQLRSEEKVVDARLRGLREQQTKKNALAKDVADLTGRYELIAKEIKELKGKDLGEKTDLEEDIRGAAKRLEDAKESEKDLMQKERKAQERLSKLLADMSNAEKSVAEKNKLSKALKDADKKSLEAAHAKAKAGADELEKELAGVLSGKKENEKWITELKKHISKCPVCERDLSQDIVEKLLHTKNELLKKADSDAKELQSRVERTRADADALNKEINAARIVEDKLKELVDADQKVKEISASLDSAKKEHEKAKGDRDRAVDAVQKLGEESEKLKSKRDLITKRDAYLKQEKDIKADLEKKSAEHAAIKVSDKDVDAAQKEAVDLKSGIGRMDAESSAKEKYLGEKNAQIAEKKADIERVERMLTDIVQKKAAIDNLAKFKNALEEAQVQMRTRLIGAINDVMQEVWPELYPYGDYTGIMLEPTADDYLLKVKTKVGGREAWENVESIASGGERSIGCLAMRVAFALVLVPNLKWLILDEPTHNIDREGLEKFVKVFNEMLPRIVDQVFIITHDEILKQVSTAKIYVLNRNKEESGATVVQEV